MAEPVASDLNRALDLLFRRTAHGIRPGLEVSQAILERIGHPQRAFPVIHVAGTNGKGSVCALVENMLRVAGYRTALYTSPHLIQFNERIRVNGVCITDTELAALLEEIVPMADRACRDAGLREATFFELSTVIAFEHFRRNEVQIGVIETGMGGRWDATNVVEPCVTAISRIDWDHMNYLGASMEGIAGEKAGIIKRGVPVICGPMGEDALRIVTDAARTRGAVCIPSAERVSIQRLAETLRGQKIAIETENGRYPRMSLPLLGDHQLENAAIAVLLAETLSDTTEWAVDPEAIRRGIERVYWPARCQVLDPDPVTILDVAHNPGGARALAGTLDRLRARQELGLIVGFLADKDARGFMECFRGRVARCWATPIRNERAMTSAAVASTCAEAGITAIERDPGAAWTEARAWAASGDRWICIAGSLYLAGEILRQQWGEGGVCARARGVNENAV